MHEFYSSPDGSVQFIEMHETAGLDFEYFTSPTWFKTDDYNQDMSETLGSDLYFPTGYKKFLVGSESYAALPDVPAPDFVLPDGFLDPSGDTVFWAIYEVIEIAPGVLPTDGIHSITVVDPAVPTFAIAVSSPTNFAGETGTVLTAPAVPSLGPPGAALLIALALGAALALRHRP